MIINDIAVTFPWFLIVYIWFVSMLTCYFSIRDLQAPEPFLNRMQCPPKLLGCREEQISFVTEQGLHSRSCTGVES